MNSVDRFNYWIENVRDNTLSNELHVIKNSVEEIEKRFSSDLTFGTGGLRGILGVGTNRLNIYTVAKITQGIANYINSQNIKDKKVAISYDSRINSSLFAKTVCEVLAANSISTYIYKELMPTPCLSFAVRALKCCTGIMITASHNPSDYNGYKVYGSDGGQITLEAAETIQNSITTIDVFKDVKQINFEEEINKGLINYIDEEVFNKFISNIKQESVLFGDEVDKNISIIYTPLNGSALKPTLRILKETGFNNVTVVKEQEQPDGNFPTCKYPNPEYKPALEIGLEYCKNNDSDLLIATDPDGDRVGVSIKTDNGYEILTGNEVGLLLFDFICSQRIKHNKMPSNPVLVKTIVTSNLAEKIANKYNVKVINVLTGFKFIGEQIGVLEKNNQLDSYIFGFEESCGYLSGGYVRDKDAIDGLYLVCEMCAYYKMRNISIKDKLEEIYKEHGYMINDLLSYTADNKEVIDIILNQFRNNKFSSIVDNKIAKFVDYNNSIDNLPKSNVVSISLDNNSSFIIRPSGTEPKIKVYLSSTTNSREESIKNNEILTDWFNKLFIENGVNI